MVTALNFLNMLTTVFHSANLSTICTRGCTACARGLKQGEMMLGV